MEEIQMDPTPHLDKPTELSWKVFMQLMIM